MTVSTNDRRKTYLCNGVTVDFDGPRAMSADDISVYLVNNATGTSAMQVSGYTLTGVGAQNTHVKMDAAPSSDYSLVILRTVPYSQECDLTNQGAYLPEVLESSGLDPLAMQIQQLADSVDRAIRFPDSMLDYNPVIGGTYVPGGQLLLGSDGKSIDVGTPSGSADLLLRGDLNTGSAGKGADLVKVFRQETGAIPRTVNDKLREVVTPEDFGAVGDGVTDDCAAIDRALLALKSIGGGILRLARGKTYMLSSVRYGIGTALCIPSNVTIFAYGATLKIGSTAIALMMRNDSDGTVGGYAANRDITILGGTYDPNYGEYPVGSMAMGFAHCMNIHIRDAHIYNGGASHHLEINSSSRVLVEGCVFEGGASLNDPTMEALQIDGAIATTWGTGPYDNTFCTNIKIIGNTFLNCGSGVGSHSSVSGKRHSIITIANNLFSSSYFCGVRGMNWENAVIVGNVFYGGALGVRMQADASTINEGLVISNNIFWKIGLSGQAGAGFGHAIYLFGNSAGTEQYNHFTINGNVIRDCDQPTSGAGIKVNYCPYGTINGNAIDNLTTGTGIAVFGNGDISIIGNRVKNTSGPSISAQALGSLVVSSNIVGTIDYTSITRSLVTNNIVANGGGITSGGTNTDTHTVNNLVGTVYA